MSRDPNMVWGGTMDEFAKINRKMHRVKSRIDSYKRLIEKDRNGRWPDPRRQADLALDMQDAITQLARLEAKYESGLKPWDES